MSRIFDRGDLVRLTGQSNGPPALALVITPTAFNRLGVSWIAPISQAGGVARYAGFAVGLAGTGARTQGAVLVNLIRALDLSTHGAKLVEKAPQAVVDEATARLQAILKADWRG